jgi:hypothetical protein
MRKNHIFSIVSLIVIGLGVKLFFFSAPPAVAEADVIKGLGLDVSHMHDNKNLPKQHYHDMSFVFSAPE